METGIMDLVRTLKNGGMDNLPFPEEKAQIQLNHCTQPREL